MIELSPAATPGYTRDTLFECADFQIVRMNWEEGSISALHDHGFSRCWILIESGVFENYLELGAKSETHLLEAGNSAFIPVAARHEIRCLKTDGRALAQTLQVYSPPLQDRPPDLFDSDQKDPTLLEALKLHQPTSLPELAQIFSQIRKSSISTDSPFFMNQLFAGLQPQVLLAEELADQTRTTMATREVSPVFTRIEEELVEKLGAQIGWPLGERHGVCVPGGSAANFMALHLARHVCYPQAKRQGLGPAKLRIFCSEESHYSLAKACITLGLGTDALVKVPVNREGQINPSELERLIDYEVACGHRALAVVATAGTTVKGAFDQLPAIAGLCKNLRDPANKIWLHVDAAWGGPALFSRRRHSLFAGVELCDSLTIDAHKFFGSSLTCSFLLTRHKQILLEANDVDGGEYLFHTPHDSLDWLEPETGQPGLDRGRLSWQCGRGPDALSFWALWKSLGTEGLADFIDQRLQLARELSQWISSQPRLKLIHAPQYLNVCVRVAPPEGLAPEVDWSLFVRNQLRLRNLAFVNYSEDEGGAFLRLILAHPQISLTQAQEILLRALQITP